MDDKFSSDYLLLPQELLKLLGMPVLRARGEAEALCAQLNSEGFVDACITADSDAFLFVAKCVIKQVDPKSMVMPLLIQSLNHSYITHHVWVVFPCFHS